MFMVQWATNPGTHGVVSSYEESDARQAFAATEMWARSQPPGTEWRVALYQDDILIKEELDKVPLQVKTAGFPWGTAVLVGLGYLLLSGAAWKVER